MHYHDVTEKHNDNSLAGQNDFKLLNLWELNLITSSSYGIAKTWGNLSIFYNKDPRTN